MVRHGSFGTSMRAAIASFVWLSFAGAALAQQPAVPAPPVVAASAAKAGTAGDVDRRVIEDDGVRIEETRRRGEVQRITVQSKIGNAKPYEIVPGRGGRDPSQDKGSAGQRVWSLFAF